MAGANACGAVGIGLKFLDGRYRYGGTKDASGADLTLLQIQQGFRGRRWFWRQTDVGRFYLYYTEKSTPSNKRTWVIATVGPDAPGNLDGKVVAYYHKSPGYIEPEFFNVPKVSAERRVAVYAPPHV